MLPGVPHADLHSSTRDEAKSMAAVKEAWDRFQVMKNYLRRKGRIFFFPSRKIGSHLPSLPPADGDIQPGRTCTACVIA